MSRTITVLGGDARQALLARALTARGYPVECHGVPGLPDSRDDPSESIRRAGVLLLPMPAVSDGCIRGTALDAARLLRDVRPGTRICGGRLAGLPIPEGCPVYDLGEDEALAVLNAVPTAEAAIAIALGRLRRTLWGSPVLVVGCGRIGKLLAQRLLSFGSRVSVSSRKDADAAWCESAGCIPERTGAYRAPLSEYRCIFSTVPAPVFTPEQIKSIAPDCPVIDLASLPGGLPQGCPAPEGYTPALALPGKYFPETAAELILSRLLPYLETEACYV